MYNNDFFLTWEKTDDELKALFTVADALRNLRERNISTKIFDSGLGISLFRDNSTRTRFSFASACNLLGLEVQDLDEGKSQIAHSETVRETAMIMNESLDNARILRYKDNHCIVDTGQTLWLMAFAGDPLGEYTKIMSMYSIRPTMIEYLDDANMPHYPQVRRLPPARPM